jgi:allophanate hydrolase
MNSQTPLDIASITAAYAAGTDPRDLIRAVYARIAEDKTQRVWISVPPLAQVMARLDAAIRQRDAGHTLPLFGIPFAAKDNIDVADIPTTAACPAFAYTPSQSATVIEKLEAAGAIFLGKTNLDQFATGLVGVRSPYGIPACALDERYVSGGSSSGSAVAVAKGLVSFSLGTDTAGSGRVPASFNNIVGIKPTRGWLSARGLVPACRSLDCISVFAGTVEDAALVTQIAGGFDIDDPYSRAETIDKPVIPLSFRFGVPSKPLDFFGDGEAATLYADSIVRLESLGGKKVEIDFAAFAEASDLLYHGPWVAERLAAIKDFAVASPDALHPITRQIILGANSLTAVDVFEGQYKLAALAKRTAVEWDRMDVMLLPTAGTIYRIDELAADPIQLNTNLGRYTNFTNLLDLAAVAVPAGFRTNGLPFGVTLFAPAFGDDALATLSARLHRALKAPTIGATSLPLPPTPLAVAPASDTIPVAVVGAHLSGYALNHELLDCGATLIRTARTTKGYSLYALDEGKQGRPGLVFDGTGAGEIEVELWAMPLKAFGGFVAAVKAPLGIGTIALADGSTVKGFLCEAHAAAGTKDITRFGGWRAYLGAT